MREHERIDRITGKMNTLWKRHPSLRFGQLLKAYVFTDPRFIFVQEDEETEMHIDEVNDEWMNCRR